MGEHDPADLDEARLLRRLRVISGLVVLALIALLVLVDSFGRLIVRNDFHVSELFLGTLVGALLLLVGIDVAARLPGRHDG